MTLEYLHKDSADFVGEFNTTDEMWKLVRKKIKDIGFDSYYVRMFMGESKDNCLFIDYGSHVNFLIVKNPEPSLLKTLGMEN